jgi:hypothetical protein
MPFMEAYVLFVKNNAIALDRLDTLKRNKSVVAALKSVEKTEKSLDVLLETPNTRLQQYEIWLEV